MASSALENTDGRMKVRSDRQTPQRSLHHHQQPETLTNENTKQASHGHEVIPLTLMLVLDSVEASPTTGGSSKEAGPSSSVNGGGEAGLVGVCVEDAVTMVTGAELGDGRGKAGGNILKPGLIGEGIRAPGDKARLACSSETVMGCPGCQRTAPFPRQQNAPGLT